MTAAAAPMARPEATRRRAMEHEPWLDGVRFAAAAMVFLHHLQAPGLHWLTGGGDVGVMVFLALSGYLLYRPFALGGDVDLQVYAVRRLLRIAPAYLVAAIGVAWLLGVTPDPLGVLTMTNTPIVVAWTLQLEIVFYAVLPLLAAVLRRFGLVGRLRFLGWVGFGSIAFGALVVAFGRVVPNDGIAYLWAFLPGMAVAELSVARPAWLAAVPVRLALVAATLLLLASSILVIGYPDLPGALGAVLLLVALRGVPVPGRRTATALAIGGALTYPVYLWHVPLIDRLNRPTSWPGVALALAATIAVASVSYVVVERPAIRLGRRLRRSSRADRGTDRGPDRDSDRGAHRDPDRDLARGTDGHPYDRTAARPDADGYPPG